MKSYIWSQLMDLLNAPRASQAFVVYTFKDIWHMKFWNGKEGESSPFEAMKTMHFLRRRIKITVI